jgi:hypothetical protein
MMNRKLWTSSVLTAALGMAADFTQAQEPPPLPHTMMQEVATPGVPPFGPAIELMGFEGMHGGKVVTGAPFSGIAVSETTQTLADGNHITRKVQTNLYRDSQGRFRKEVNLSGVGLLTEAGQPETFIVIHDPVANVGYSLEPQRKVARRTSMEGPRTKGIVKDRMASRLQKGLADGTGQKEDLGTQTINGVTATGTRYTRTIPAGQIGNEKPINTVYEEWYSNDLQVVVKSTRNDPRFGTRTYTLTNIQRAEPDASLFQLPTGYTLKEGGPRKHVHGELPPPPPGLE